MPSWLNHPPHIKTVRHNKMISNSVFINRSPQNISNRFQTTPKLIVVEVKILIKTISKNDYVKSWTILRQSLPRVNLKNFKNIIKAFSRRELSERPVSIYTCQKSTLIETKSQINFVPNLEFLICISLTTMVG
ncbi:hypothetical protein Hanom_Chr15g01351711 [Helianthus anomalus]